MKSTTSPPPELQAFASLFAPQPPEVREAFQFLLATAIHEVGKSELLNVGKASDETDYITEVPATRHNWS
ncbi:MAG: hypothetical protein H8E40_00125 [Chloroflexi bacterium]|nr:hypothetical protein [Chloroflexota bacterium]